jgi:hypothetical protein
VNGRCLGFTRETDFVREMGMQGGGGKNCRDETEDGGFL